MEHMRLTVPEVQKDLCQIPGGISQNGEPVEIEYGGRLLDWSKARGSDNN